MEVFSRYFAKTIGKLLIPQILIVTDTLLATLLADLNTLFFS